jgi:hypothetical protein
MLAALSACASVPPAPGPVTGEWGGTHVGLKLTATGGVLDYDCAAGTIDEPVVLHADRSFHVVGTHTPGWGGPERSGEVRPTYRTRYSGLVRGDRMILEGRVENGVLLGPLTLVRGAEPVIMRCL